MYRTRQKEELLEFMESHPGVHITVSDICRYFREDHRPIGTATVYRQLERMVDEGLVNKYVLGVGSPACFEYIAGDEKHDSESCFHCKCEKCGKLIHLHCDELKEIQSHLKSSHDFVLDPIRTVFYGLCTECAGDCAIC